MPYDQASGGSPAAAGLEAGGSDMPGAEAPGAEKPGVDNPSQDTIHIQADMLPPGMKEGDMLKCTGMDENGCQFELVKAKQDEDYWGEGGGFVKEMSAKNPTEEAS